MTRHVPSLAGAVAILLPSIACAQWIGAANGQWGTAANWTGGVVPNSVGAIADINTALTVNVSDTGTAGTYPYTWGTLATNITSGSVIVGNNTVTTDQLTAAVASGSPIINVSSSGGTIFYYADILGTQGLAKNGAGKFTFRFNGADQIYSGNIAINAGIFGINQNGSLGNDNNDITIANGARLLAEPGSNTGTITLPATRTITLTGTQSQIGAGAAAVNLSILGDVSGTGAVGLTKTDAGKVSLDGSASWSGDTRIVGGILDFNLTSGNFLATGEVLVNGGSGTKLDLSDLSSFTHNAPTKNFTIRPVTSADGSTAYTMDATLAKNGSNSITALTVNVGSASGSSTGPSHTGLLALGQSNVINTDTLTIGGFNSQGKVAFQSGLTTPTLTVASTSGGTSSNWIVGWTSSGVRTGQGVLDLTGGTLSATVNNIVVSRHSAGASNSEASSVILPGGSLSASSLLLGDKSASGAPTLNATFTQSGASTAVSINTITFGNEAAAGATPRFLSTYNLNGGTLRAALIDGGAGGFATNSVRNLNINGGTLRNLNSSTDLLIDGVDATAGGRVNVVVGSSGATFTADSGRSITLTSFAPVTGTSTLTKSGAGTLTLANGTIATQVNVDAGTLRNDGTISGAVLVTSAGTLQGTGSFSADTTVQGVLRPGNSIGTLTWTSGNLNLVGSTTQMEIAASSSLDQVVLSSNGSTLTYDGALEVTFTGAPGVGTYDLFNVAGSSAGDFDSVQILSIGGLSLGSPGMWSGIYSGLLYTFTIGTGDLVVATSAVPEPLTATGVLLLASRLLGRRNRAGI